MISLETANELMARSRRRAAWSSPRTILLLMFGAVIGAMLTDPGMAVSRGLMPVLLPQALLISALGWVWTRTRRQQRIIAKMTSAWEAIQWKDWSRAEALVLQVLSRPVQPPPLRAQSLMALAAVADHQKQFDVAQHVLENVLQDPTMEPSHRFAARVALAGTMLRTGQLSDSIEMIDRLSRLELPEAFRAQVEFLKLFRYVVMGQVEEATSGAQERRALFRRHLSTRAGYAYGLLSLAFDRAGQASRAEELWRDATLLLPPTEIVDRFAELQAVAVKYAATEWPL